jgi:hypothetical protein
MNLSCRRVQADEAWAFCYAKQKNVPTAKKAPEGAGDIWTWVGLDAETKLAALAFMTDLAKRLANRVQLTTDGHRAYLEAVEETFGTEIDYAQLVKIYGPARKVRAATVPPNARARSSTASKATPTRNTSTRPIQNAKT